MFDNEGTICFTTKLFCRDKGQERLSSSSREFIDGKCMRPLLQPSDVEQATSVVEEADFTEWW
ncbi:hypothetical protein QKW35_13925 [Pontibacterium granulatum]|uniref:hypothetical protein n=1 Tax=Pontibacterium granulatum TaxID=2036029 RepID=UPI00249A55A6|nr:hypothetical protein [Pontibacterium granulatum]MDI3325476.1 hypothetical protein [Pontibacterium granulatum]